MRKTIKFSITKTLVISLLSFFALTISCNKYVNASPIDAPNVDAEGIILLDGTTNKVLYEKNSDKVLKPASTTKVLTALIVFEECNLSDKVVVSKNPPCAEGTSIGLKEGDTYTVEELLHGLLLESANDCAEALAEHVSGSIEAFATHMNERAKKLGANSSNFVNPSGLCEGNHTTTAHDLALIMNAAYKIPDFVRISREPLFKLPESVVDHQVKWVNNKDELINSKDKYFYEYALTGKTGYTTESRHTFTSVAQKDGHSLVLAILKCNDKNTYFTGAKDLFEYGFNNFSFLKLYKKGDTVTNYKLNNLKEIPLIASQDFSYVVKNSEINKNDSPEDIIKNLNLVISPEQVDLSQKSFSKDDELMDSTVYSGDTLIGHLKLSSGETVTYSPQKSFFENNKIVIVSSICFVCFVLIILIIRIINKRKKRKRRSNKH